MSKKKANLDSGFLISYDWLPALESLSGEDYKALLTALIKRQKDKAPFPTFENPTVGIFADMIEPTIKRRLDGQKGGLTSSDEDTTTDTTIPTTVDTGSANKVKKRKVDNSRVDISRENIKSTSPYKPPKGADVMAERFDMFWSVYPKKIGKGAAEKAFRKIAPSKELLQTMLDAIDSQCRSEQWKRDHGQYIPNPTTWLNQKRWEDETNIKSETPDITLDELFN